MTDTEKLKVLTEWHVARADVDVRSAELRRAQDRLATASAALYRTGDTDPKPEGGLR